jgi:hypothetical protein
VVQAKCVCFTCVRTAFYRIAVIFCFEIFYFDKCFNPVMAGILLLWQEIYSCGRKYILVTGNLFVTQKTFLWREINSFGRNFILVKGNLFLWQEFYFHGKNFIPVNMLKNHFCGSYIKCLWGLKISCQPGCQVDYPALPRKLNLGMQPYFDQTRKTTSQKNGKRLQKWIMEGNLIKINGRWPQF